MPDAEELLRILVERPEWMRRAACSGMTHAFFPEGSGPPPSGARLICEGCAVTRECLGYAVVNRENWGVWGGMGPKQRRRVRAVVSESIKEGRYL